MIRHIVTVYCDFRLSDLDADSVESDVTCLGGDCATIAVDVDESTGAATLTVLRDGRTVILPSDLACMLFGKPMVDLVRRFV